MYDEHQLVLSTLNSILKHFINPEIIIVHSDNGTILSTSAAVTYIKLPNIATTVTASRLPSYSITRNFSTGFSNLYEKGKEYDMIVAMTGDTLVTDASSFNRRYADLAAGKFYAAVSQAVGQRFHASTDDPDAGRTCGRIQHNNTTDFACCLFLVDGEFANKTKVFSSIKVTNEFSSEQCLGDELMSAMGVSSNEEFHTRVYRLNNSTPHIAYSYNDGVVYHARTGGRPGR
jgi:hypothetical protein